MLTSLQRAVIVAEGRTSDLQDSFSDLWTRILVGKNPIDSLELLQSEGVLKETFPEIQTMVGFGGHGQGHKDLWDHTLKVVHQAKNRPAIRWAALFHDVGKPSTFSRESGKVTFHRHESVSARLFKRAMRRTGLLDEALVSKVHFMIKNLGLVEAYASDWTDSAVRRLHKELGEHFDDVLLLARADNTSRNFKKRQRNLARTHELSERAKAIATADAIVPPLPKGLGNDIMSAFNLPPGPKVGDVMSTLKEAVEAGKIKPHQEAGYYIEFLGDNRVPFGL